MKAVLFGATGMVGQGVLKECLRDAQVEEILSIGRSSLGLKHPKLRELRMQNFANYEGLDATLTGFDACFFCLGTQQLGKSEAEYMHITYDFAIAAAEVLSRLNPAMTFIYVSGEGADSSETSRTMWARVRGKTENALLRMPFKAVYVFRPAVIQPLGGIESKTRSYRLLYKICKPILPIIRKVLPGYVTSTEQLGRAMIFVSLQGYPMSLLKSRDFNAIGEKKKEQG